MPGKRNLANVSLVGLLLILATVGAYLGVIQLDYTNYDDPYYVTENPPVRAGLSWNGLVWAFTHAQTGNWHPVTWISHMLDTQLYGLNPGGAHLTNLFFHVANTLILFLFLRSLSGALWPSAAVAGLFGLHPLHVESVAWIAERKDVLSAFWGLLALWAYARYARGAEGSIATRSSDLGMTTGRVTKSGGRDAALRRPLGGTPGPDGAARRPYLQKQTLSLALGLTSGFVLPTSAWYGLALAFFTLGLMSKAMLVTWPGVMLLLDYWPLGRLRLDKRSEIGSASLYPLIGEKVPFFVLAAASCVITLVTQRSGGAMAPLDQVPIGMRLVNALMSYLLYLGKVVWPGSLSPIYPYVRSWPTPEIVVAACLLMGATWLCIRQRHRRPYLLAGWAWYLGTLVPVIGLVQVGTQSMADRYTYLPSIGLFLLLAWSISEFVGNKPARRKLAGCATAIALFACTLVTQSQVLYWQNTETLFRHALSVTRDNFVVYNSLGFYFADFHETSRAREYFQRALAINPRCAYSWSGLARVAIDERKYDEAIAACENALNLDPSLAEAQATMGAALMRQGRIPDAINHYVEALRLRPNYAEAHYNLANVLARQGQVQQARIHYQQAIRFGMPSADAHNNLAYMLVREGRLVEAMAEFRAALELRPALWQARYGLADALLRQGQTAEAASEFAEILRQKPDFVEGMNRLAWILATSADERNRDGAQAVRLAERACQLTGQPQSTLMGTLASAYAEAGRFEEAIKAAEAAYNRALAEGQQASAGRYQDMLGLFRGHRPYREGTGSAGGAPRAQAQPPSPPASESPSAKSQAKD